MTCWSCHGFVMVLPRASALMEALCCDSSDAGASVIAEDFEGKSALSAAEENGLPKMRQLLFSYI